MQLSEKEIIKAISPIEVIKPGNRIFSYFGFDSRQMKKNGLFFALKGKRDGHDFIGDAFKNGASAAVVEKKVGEFPCFMVKNTLESLGKAAEYTIRNCSSIRIGITGSAGKTTTKEFLYHFISSEYSTEKTPGNWNNLIGVPVFLLNRNPSSEALIIEMGISEPGEMDKLVEIAKPKIALITRIYPTHTEFLSNIEGVKREKEGILRHAETGVFNLDDPNQSSLWKNFKGKKIFYSISREADVNLISWKRISNTSLSLEIFWKGKELSGVFSFWSPVFIENLLASLAVASAVMNKTPDFRKLEPLDGRGKTWEKDGVLFIDESYNSNPSSLLRSLISLQELEGTKIAVLADMLELRNPEEEHRRTGKLISDLKIHRLIFVGPLMKFAAEEASKKRDGVFWVKSAEEVSKKLQEFLKPGSIVFFKGSHSTGLWKEAEKWM